MKRVFIKHYKNEAPSEALDYIERVNNVLKSLDYFIEGKLKLAQTTSITVVGIMAETSDKEYIDIDFGISRHSRTDTEPFNPDTGILFATWRAVNHPVTGIMLPRNSSKQYIQEMCNSVAYNLNDKYAMDGNYPELIKLPLELLQGEELVNS